MRGSRNRGDEPKPEHSNHGYVISERQLEELESCLEHMEIGSVSLRSIPSRMGGSQLSVHTPLQTIYMLYRAYPEPVRIYIGQSFFGRERILNQIRNRKWATHVVSLEMGGYLYRGTLRLIETCILRRGLKTFPGALWHNEQGLVAPCPDPLSKMPCRSEVDALVSRILKVFGDALPRSAFEPLTEHPVTHVLGGPSEEVFGLLSQRGRRILLLKGSRVSARARNITALWDFGGTGWRHGSRLHWEGKLEPRRATHKRPAGLIITEPVRFNDKQEVVRFLTLDDPRFQESWYRAETYYGM